MAIKATPLGPGTLKITPPEGEAAEFSGQMTEVTLEPSIDEGDTITTLSHEEIADEATVEWKLEGELLQDFGDGTLLLWAQEHHGKLCSFEFIPTTGQKLKATGNVVPSVLSIGGTPKKRNTSKLSWKALNVRYASVG